MTDLALDQASSGDLDQVVALLSASDLPTDDVRDGDATFYRANDGGELVGVAGLEPCGEDALLRSVAVRERHRGRGYGSAIVDAVAERARRRDVRRLYLLTTTAAGFFAGEGFREGPRDSVPEPVRSTSEFADLCPDSATVMVRDLRRG